jgi:hypothetical protein
MRRNNQLIQVATWPCVGMALAICTLATLPAAAQLRQADYDANLGAYDYPQAAAEESGWWPKWSAGCCNAIRRTGLAPASYSQPAPAYAEGEMIAPQTDDSGVYFSNPFWYDESAGADYGYGYGGSCGSGCFPSWYASAEAIYFQREPESSRIAPGAPADEFDFEWGGRLTVGRYFDCVSGFEVSFLGGLEYEQSGTIVDPTGAGALGSPFGDIGGLGANALFGNAVAQQLVYDSRMNNLEFNYVENGWNVVTMLVGTRYINLDERFRFGALGPAGQTAVLDIQTENHLIGVQVGGDIRHPVFRRGMFGTKLKLGGFINPAQTRLVVGSAPGGVAINNDDDDLGVSALIESGAFYQVQLLPGASVRVGYEFWYIWGLALAPDQTDFVLGADEGSSTDVEGDTWFYGPTAGVEIAW